MAKQDEEFNFDFDGFDDFQDNGEADFSQGKKSTGARKALTEFAGSFLSGIKKDFMNPVNQREFLADSLPKGFVASYDAATNVKDTVSDIYDTGRSELGKVAKELKPGLKTINQVYGKNIPSSDKGVGKAKKWFDGWVNSDDGESRNREPSEQEQLTSMFSEVFGDMKKLQAADTTITNDAIKDASNKAMLGNVTLAKTGLQGNQILDKIGLGIESLNQYNKVDAKVSAKALELQLKSYAVQRKTLEVLEQTKELNKAAYENIIKNTALPDAVKVKNWEVFNKVGKEKLFGKVQERVSMSLGDLLGNVKEKVGTKLKENIQAIGGMAGMMTDGLAMSADMEAQMAEMGMGSSKTQKAGGLAGTAAGWLMRKYGGEWVKKNIAGNEKVKQASDTALNVINDAPFMFQRLLQNNSNPFLQSLFQLTGLDELAIGDNVKVRQNPLEELDAAAAWNMQDHIALTEIIPGHLAAVRAGIESLVSGKRTEEMRYDYETGKFTSVSALKDKYTSKFFKSDSAERVSEYADKVIADLDKGNQLSKKAKTALKKYIIKEAQKDTGRIDIRALMSDDSPLPNDVADEVAMVLSGEDNFDTEIEEGYDASSLKNTIRGDFNKNAKYQNRALAVHEAMENLKMYVPRNMKDALQLAQAGNIDLLEEIGLVSEKNGLTTLNRENELDAYMAFDEQKSRKSRKKRTRNNRNPGDDDTGGIPTTIQPIQPDGGGGTEAAETPKKRGRKPKASAQESSPAESSFNIGEERMSLFEQNIVNAINSNSTKELVTVSNQLLDTIRMQLEMGIPTSEADPDATKGIKRRMGMFGKLVNKGKDTLGGAKTGLTKYFQWSYGKMLPGALSLAGKATMLPFKAMGAIGDAFGKRKLGNITDFKAKFLQKIGDIYAEGQDEPVLTRDQMKHGSFTDKNTGKIIREFGDITGPVIDGDGNYKITQEQFDAGLKTIRKGSFSLLALKGLNAGLGGVIGTAKLAMSPFKLLKKVGSWALDKLTKSKEKFQDVYVNGEKSPRLLASQLKAGEYFNSEGKVIKKFEDIKGDIKDKAGNVILSVQEMSKGDLTDKFGKPLEALKEKGTWLGKLVAGAAKGTLGLAWGAAKSIVKLPMKIMGKVMKGLGKAGSWMLGKVKKKTGGNISWTDLDGLPLEIIATQADTLVNIHKLLEDRLPKDQKKFNDQDGDGFREGSRESFLARAKAKMSPGKTDESKEKKPRKSIFGLVVAALSGLGGIFGAVRAFGARMLMFSKVAMSMKLASATAGALSSFAGLLGGRGKVLGKVGGAAGAAAGAGQQITKMSKLMTLVKGSKMVKLAGMGSLVGLGYFGSSLFTSADAKASDGVFDKAANVSAKDMDNVLKDGNTGDTTDSGGLFSSIGKSLQELGEGMGAPAVGAVGGILGLKALDALKNKFGSKTPIAPPTGFMGKAAHLMFNNKYGRIAAAGLAGMGLYTGYNAITEDGKEQQIDKDGNPTPNQQDVQKTNSGIGAGAVLGLGATALGGKAIFDRLTTPAPTPVTFSNLASGVNPNSPLMPNAQLARATSPVPNMANTGAINPRAPITPASQVTPGASVTTPAPATNVAKPGILRRVGGSIMRNAGPLGIGLAAYDAATTEGTLWDKAKAGAVSLGSAMAIGKGMSMLGNTKIGQGAKGLFKKGFQKLGGETAKTAIKEGSKKILQKVGGEATKRIAMQAGRQALMQVGRTALIGIASTLGAPVVLGALAIGTAGYLAYKGYQRWFKKDKQALVRFRMAQYGYDLDDENQAKVVLQFEDYISKFVQVSEGKASFKKGLDQAKILNIFGIQPKDKEEVERFGIWFAKRFRPVYLSSRVAYKSVSGGKDDLNSADAKFTKEEKLKYLSLVNAVEGDPYSTMESPLPGKNKVKYDAKDVKKAYEKAVRDVNKEKSSEQVKKENIEASEKAEDKAMRKTLEDKMLADEKTDRDSIQKRLDDQAAKGSWWDKTKAFSFGAYNKVASSWLGQMASKTTNTVQNSFGGGTVVSMTKSQKEYQMMVYKGFMTAGFSEAQSKALTAEVGRENSYNPKYLFGGHADPHKGANLGMISWQGTRRTQLAAFLKERGALVNGDTIKQSQEGIDAQCQFIMWELKNTEKSAGNKFLPYKDIDYATAVRVLGKLYIRWRIDDPKYAAQGARNRDGFYKMLLQQLEGGVGKDDVATANTKVDSSAKTDTAASGNVATNTGLPDVTKLYQIPGMETDKGKQSPAIPNQPGLGVLKPEFLNQGTGGISVELSGDVPKDHRAVKAATYATQKAHGKSTGYCARYVANALQAAGYKFTRQPSAFMYASKGIMESMGFTRISGNKYQIGDVMVWPAHGGKGGGGVHGHIQIFNGKNWVSDFIQRTYIPGQHYKNSTPSLWRDSTLLGKQISGSVSTQPVDATASTANTKTDTSAKTDTADGTSATTQNSTAQQVTEQKAETEKYVAGQNNVLARFQVGANGNMVNNATANPVETPTPSTPTNNVVTADKLATGTTTASSAKTTSATTNRQQQTEVNQNAEVVNVLHRQLEVQEKILGGILDLKKAFTDGPGQANKERPMTNEPKWAAGQTSSNNSNVPVSMSTFNRV